MFSQKIKDIAKVVFALYAINNFTLPIGYAISDVSTGLQNKNIQETMSTYDYGFNYQGSDKEVSLDYLKLAHAITSKNIRYCREQWPTDDENLENGVGDCYQLSRFTFSNFLALVDQNDRQDLGKYVRLAFGEASSPDDGAGHAWLEILTDQGWTGYETTAIDFPHNIYFDPSIIDSVILDEEVLDIARLDYNRTFFLQRKDDGNFKSKVDLQGMLKSKGLAYHLYSSVKHSL